MVKNTQGGSKHKSQARKLVNAPKSNKLRKSECDEECYAIVSKMLGNGMCHVNLSYQNNILTNIICHIRGKFRGRNKKSNLVTSSSIILVGLRTWEKDISACDLMEIYTSNDISLLNIQPSLLSSINHFNSILPNDDNFSFSSQSNIIDHTLNHNHNHNDNHNHKLNDLIDFDSI